MHGWYLLIPSTGIFSFQPLVRGCLAGNQRFNFLISRISLLIIYGNNISGRWRKINNYRERLENHD
jgi:hypothetical protein